MPIYLQWAMSTTQIVLAGAVLVAVGFAVWDLIDPPDDPHEEAPEWWWEETGNPVGRDDR